METDRFDRMVRSLAIAPSRRGVLRLLAGGPLTTGLFATLGWDAVAGKGKKKRCQPKCKACQKCRKGKCKLNEKKEGKRCGTDKVCAAGRCVRRCGKGGPCRVFFTNLDIVGSEIGGLTGGDAICQQLAEDAGLPGTFLAWLSAGTDSPATRFTNQATAGPYQLVPFPANDGNNLPPTVAASFADLTSCDAGGECLQHPINRDETGFPNDGNVCAWTGTKPDGTPAADNCGGWMADGTGLDGLISRVNAEWTDFPVLGQCDGVCALYCFEQA